MENVNGKQAETGKQAGQAAADALARAAGQDGVAYWVHEINHAVGLSAGWVIKPGDLPIRAKNELPYGARCSLFKLCPIAYFRRQFGIWPAESRRDLKGLLEGFGQELGSATNQVVDEESVVDRAMEDLAETFDRLSNAGRCSLVQWIQSGIWDLTDKLEMPEGFFQI